MSSSKELHKSIMNGFGNTEIVTIHVGKKNTEEEKVLFWNGADVITKQG